LDGIPLEKPILSVFRRDVATQVNHFRGMRGKYEVISEGGVQVDDVVNSRPEDDSDGTPLKEQADVRLVARRRLWTAWSSKIGRQADRRQGRRHRHDHRDDSGRTTLSRNFAASRVTFEFKIKDVQRMHLPEMNEEFLKGFGFDSAEDLNKWCARAWRAGWARMSSKGCGARSLSTCWTTRRSTCPSGLATARSTR